VNVTLWPSKAGQTDFLHEGQRFISATPRSSADKDFTAALFLSQKNVLDPATTLYTVFFGIKCATTILFRLKMLTYLVDLQ
jgi:hypothetical protein